MRLHFDPDEGLIVIPTRLWGQSGDVIVQLALDTGATGSLELGYIGVFRI
jgi:hypothetical protein